MPFRLQVLLDRKNLRDGSLFHETYCKPPPSPSRDREDPRALPGTLVERGCNNPNFWEIEINGFIKISNFGDNKNFYF
jgi:hypothetical protein